MYARHVETIQLAALVPIHPRDATSSARQKPKFAHTSSTILAEPVLLSHRDNRAQMAAVESAVMVSVLALDKRALPVTNKPVSQPSGWLTIFFLH